MALFGKVIKFLGDETLLDNVCHWGQALRACSLDLIPVSSPNLYILCEGNNDTSQLPASPPMLSLIVTMMDLIPLNHKPKQSLP